LAVSFAPVRPAPSQNEALSLMKARSCAAGRPSSCFHLRMPNQNRWGYTVAAVPHLQISYSISDRAAEYFFELRRCHGSVASDAPLPQLTRRFCVNAS
jgi:hypothetical protein